MRCSTGMECSLLLTLRELRITWNLGRNLELEDFVKVTVHNSTHVDHAWPMRLYVSCSPVLWHCILLWRNPKEQTTGLDLRRQAMQGSPYFDDGKLSKRHMEKDSWKHPRNHYSLVICVLEASAGMRCGKGTKGIKQEQDFEREHGNMMFGIPPSAQGWRPCLLLCMEKERSQARLHRRNLWKQSKQILCKRGFATILWPKLGSEFDTQRPRCLWSLMCWSLEWTERTWGWWCWSCNLLAVWSRERLPKHETWVRESWDLGWWCPQPNTLNAWSTWNATVQHASSFHQQTTSRSSIKT